MSNAPVTPITILMADDDEEDRDSFKKAWMASRGTNDVRFVTDGEELMDYLKRRGDYADPTKAPRPGLILLDLNMPRKDGREALREIKADPALRQIPVIIMTTSYVEEDIDKSYDLGASSFVTKPVTLTALIAVVQAIGQYWIEIVELPGRGVHK